MMNDSFKIQQAYHSKPRNNTSLREPDFVEIPVQITDGIAIFKSRESAFLSIAIH
jgi:hypothetical protein